MARAIRFMTDVTGRKHVNSGGGGGHHSVTDEGPRVGVGVRRKSDLDEIVTGMVPTSIQDCVQTNVDEQT